MGRFFNQKVINAVGKLPPNMESLRKQFNEEQKNAKPICSTAPKETGIATPNAGEQGKSESVIPVRRGRPRGTGRTHKGNSRKTGRIG